MTTRQEKVSSLIQQEISSYLLNESFEGITGLLTITAAEVTPDLEQAKVYFSVVGQKSEEILPVLQKHIYQIQGMLNRRLRMRKIPRVSFHADDSGEYAQRLGRIIRELHKNDPQS